MAINGPEGVLGLEPHRFACVLLVKDDWQRNQHRFYCLTWRETLFGEGSLVRAWGRRGTAMRREKVELYASPQEAWPQVRRLIHRRLRHGYRVIEGCRFCAQDEPVS